MYVKIVFFSIILFIIIVSQPFKEITLKVIYGIELILLTLMVVVIIFSIITSIFGLIFRSRLFAKLLLSNHPISYEQKQLEKKDVRTFINYYNHSYFIKLFLIPGIGIIVLYLFIFLIQKSGNKSIYIIPFFKYIILKASNIIFEFFRTVN